MEKHDTKKRIIIGLMILFVGSALLLSNFDIYKEFISEFIFRWEMILICIGVVSIVSHDGRGPGFVLIFIGLGFYLRHYIDFGSGINLWQIIFAAILITAGFAIMFKRKIKPCEQRGSGEADSEDIIDEVAVFGGGDRTIISNNFRGGKILAIFGGSNFNLTRSKMAPGNNYIDVFAVFGGMKLVVPEEWNIKINVISIFGGFSDKHRVSSEVKDTESHLIIKGFVLFGGGEIKSY